MQRVCVIGLGYIGLPTSAMFAKSGIEVIGVDISERVVEILNRGEMHIEEPGLGELVKEMVENNMFRASLTPEEADAFIIAVPTPNNNDKYKSCDLSYVISATKAIIPYIRKGNAIIIESTIAPRTTDDVIRPLVEEAGFKVGEDIYLAHCPERVLPGQIIRELVENNRIVGGCTSKCTELVAELYKSFVKGEIVLTDAKTAEMSKLMENTFRDVNIALANELAKVCNSLEINVLDVIKMANKHPRVNIHQPGPGVGGHCLAIDPYFIIEKAPELAKIIALSRETNNSMPHYVVEHVEKIVKDIKQPKMAVFGITYKGNIDDMRESPAVEIIELLEEKGYELSIHDPHVDSNEIKLVSVDEATKDADMILILADHDEFKSLDLGTVIRNMRTPIIFDTKNVMNLSMIDNSVVQEVAVTVDEIDCNIKVYNMGNLYKVQ